MRQKKILLSVASLALIFAIVAVTLAYFTDNDNATNVFTLGNIAVELHEDNGLDPEDEGYLANDDYRDWLAEQALLPGLGNKLPKRATIINTGANRSFVRARILIPASIMLPTAKLELEMTAAGWDRSAADQTVLIGGKSYLQKTVVFLAALDPGDETNEIMSAFSLDADLDQDDLAEIDAADWQIRIEVDAIQADGFADAAAAFAAFEAQMSP